MKTIHKIKELFQYQKPKFTTPETVQNIELVFPFQCTRWEYRESIGNYTYIYWGTVQIDEKTSDARIKVAYGKFASGNIMVQQIIEPDKTLPEDTPTNVAFILKSPTIYEWNEQGRRRRIAP